MVNKTAAERVAKWQALDSIPKDHSMSLMKIGKRILKGLVTPITIPQSEPEVTETAELAKKVKELQIEEQRLKIEFPAATRAMEPEKQGSEASSAHASADGTGENAEWSESSGVLVESDNCCTLLLEQHVPSDMETIETKDEASSSWTEEPSETGRASLS